MHYVVEYGDERGNSRETTYSPRDYLFSACATAVDDLFDMLRLLGVDPSVQTMPDTVNCTVEECAWMYIASAEPWETVFDPGNGDDPFTVHGYDNDRGNWSVSLGMIREA